MKKLVAYLTTGYPDKQFTTDLVLSLRENGTDKIELGVPFSDPVADGEIIEKANYRALEKNINLKDVLDVTKNIREKNSDLDIFLMGYFNSFYSFGTKKLILESQKNNISGLIIPDLPFEETNKYFKNLENNFSIIPFVAPTDSKERIKNILSLSEKNNSNFIYLVAYTGITGANKQEDLTETINHIREISNIPVYIGFGVNEKTAQEKAKNTDGVIVGSEFVRVLLDDSLSQIQKINKISQKSKNIKDLINS
jgi:tryptophan synthase alpha chain